MRQVIFTKEKYPVDTYRATLWFQELDEHINYFKRMKKMLNDLGYSTTYKKNKK